MSATRELAVVLPLRRATTPALPETCVRILDLDLDLELAVKAALAEVLFDAEVLIAARPGGRFEVYADAPEAFDVSALGPMVRVDASLWLRTVRQVLSRGATVWTRRYHGDDFNLRVSG